MFGNSALITQGSQDNTSPTVGTLSYTNVTKNSVDLSCIATDDIGVVSFKIYIDGIFSNKVITDELVNYTLTGFDANTAYAIYATAVDSIGNESTVSNTVNFTTLVDVTNSFVYITTNSTSSTWTPATIINTGDTLLWEVTGGVTIAEQEIDIPTFDMSSNTGVATVAIRSISGFTGFTDLRLTSLNILSTNITAATVLDTFSCKLNPGYSSTDITSNINLDTLVIRDTGISSIDMSTNSLLQEIYLYSNILNTISIVNNPLLSIVSIYDNDLSTATLEQVVVDIDASGVLNGELRIISNPGTLTSTVYTEYQSLITKGWFIDVVSPADPSPDTEDPLIGTLSYADETQTTVKLSATATDNVAVTEFDIYQDTVLTRTVSGNTLSSYNYTGLTAQTNYDFFTIARDAAGNSSLQSNTISFTTLSNILTGEAPTLSNFRVEDGFNNRVYFDSSETLTGTSSSGFVISGGVVTAIHIEQSLLTGHYLTVSNAFTYWDNNTIRYIGGSDIKDTENRPLFNFTLQYITNNIVEPSTSIIKYAAATTQGTGDGNSEANAWSYVYAAANAQPNTTVMMLAGQSTSALTFSVDGTTDQPIKFIGYNNDAKEVERTRTTGMVFDNTIMPLILGAGAVLDNRDYIIIKNIQVDRNAPVNPNHCFDFDYASNIVFHNVYTARGRIGFISFRQRVSTRIRLTRCYGADMDMGETSIAADYCLTDNFYACSTSESPANDYFLSYYGTPNGYSSIIRNSYIHRYPGTQHAGHGISIKADEHYAGSLPNGYGDKREYDLIENNIVINCGGAAIEARHSEVQYCVYRNNTVYSEPEALDIWQSYYGIRITSAQNNIFENNNIDAEYAVTFISSVEDTLALDSGNNNLFINNNFSGVNAPGGMDILYYESDDGVNPGLGGGGRSSNNNTFINNTIVGATGLLFDKFDKAPVGNKFINNIIIDTPKEYFDDPQYDMTVEYINNLFYNNGIWDDGYIGSNGNIDTDPFLTDKANNDFTLSASTPQSVYEGGLFTTEVRYDKAGVERTAPYSIGAYEKDVVQPNTLKPIINNFTVLDGTPDRIYFDSTEVIIATNVTGFYVSANTITSVTIAAGLLTGHYFTITSAFNFWDNNLIRYDGGSDFEDSQSNAMNPFDLQYIDNTINEPVSTGNLYVSVSGGGDGTSTGSPYTIQQGFANATAGDTVWIEKGNYGNIQLTSTNDGTVGAPIKYIGYKTTPGDSPSLPFVPETQFDQTEMPLIEGPSSTNQHASSGININSNSYIILRNLQVEGFGSCYKIDGTEYAVLDNIYGRGAHAIIYGLSNGQGKQQRVINSYVSNATGWGIVIAGSMSLTEDCYVSSNYNVGMDYQISINGGNPFYNSTNEHIVRNCDIYHSPLESNHRGHGITLYGIKPHNGSLVENCSVINCRQVLEARRDGVVDCVFRNIDILGDGYNGLVGINISSARNCIFDDIRMVNGETAILYYVALLSNDANAVDKGRDNIVKNSTFTGTSEAVRIDGDPEPGLNRTLFDNLHVNNTFSGFRWAFETTSTTDVGGTGNHIQNCIYNDIAELDYAYGPIGPHNFDFAYTNFWDFWGNNGTPETGTANLSIDPQFTNATDFIPQNAGLKAGLVVAGVEYDRNDKERRVPPTIGSTEI